MEDVEEREIALGRIENGYRPSRSAFQKRIDKLTRRLNEEIAENQALREIISRYEETIRKYKKALMEAKGRCQMAS